ncbi:MAG TPA: hypothetical protein VJH94_03050 [Candidatus Paceibacterota bacterium]
MLAIAQQQTQGIFQKTLRGKDGRLFNVCFEVIEIAGHTRARIISATPVCELKGNCAKTTTTRAYLPVSRAEPPPTPKPQEFHSYTSPFFSELDFFVSQMTRAPSLS